MRYGRSVERGFLPVFSTDTAEEAHALIVLTCQRGPDGNYYAPDLLVEQTLEHLSDFSDRLQRGWDLMQRSRAVKIAEKTSKPKRRAKR